MVIFHSPKTMAGYTRYIINFTLFDALFSFTLGVLVRPNPMYPLRASYINGWLKYFGDYGAKLSLVLVINTAGYCLSTQCCCLAYRFAALQTSQWWLDFLLSTKTWVYAYAISLFFTVVSIIIFAPIQPYQNEVRDLLIRDLQTTPNAEFPNFNGTVIFYTDYKSDYAIFAAIFIFVGFFVAEFTSIGFVFVLLKMLESRKESFSVMTYKLHRQLTVALGVQLLTPFLFIILPVTYGIIRTYWQDITAEQGRLIIDFIELYGASNSLVTLYFIKPYRTFLITKFKPILRLLTCGNYGNGSQEVVKIQPAETTLASEVINGDFNERKRSIIPVIK